jgi:hypothetical protein
MIKNYFLSLQILNIVITIFAAQYFAHFSKSANIQNAIVLFIFYIITIIVLTKIQFKYQNIKIKKYFVEKSVNNQIIYYFAAFVLIAILHYYNILG